MTVTQPKRVSIPQPKRVSIPQPSSKAIKVICNHAGRPVFDGDHYLAWHKRTGRFYVGRTEPRYYVGKYLDAAIVEFKAYVGKLENEHIPVPTGKDLEASVQGRQWEVTIDEDGKIGVADDIEASAFWSAIRKRRKVTEPGSLSADEFLIPERLKLPTDLEVRRDAWGSD